MIYRGKYPLGGTHDGVTYTAWATPKYIRHRRWLKVRVWLHHWFGWGFPSDKDFDCKPEYLAPHLREDKA